MVQIGILVGGGSNQLPFWCWGIVGPLFPHISVHCPGPIMVLVREIRVVGQFGSHSDACGLELGEVTADAAESLQVTFAGGNTKAGHCHDGGGNVKASQGNCPLEGSN
jgi:hypothetical protein